MARITRAAGHLTEEEVKRRMISDPRPLYRQRWLIISNALVEPGKAQDIARHCGVSKATVRAVIASYNRQGRPPKWVVSAEKKSVSSWRPSDGASGAGRIGDHGRDLARV